MTTARAWTLVRYPEGEPTPDLFALKEAPLPDPQAGQAMVEVLAYSVDPYMRGRMRPDVKSYIPPFALNEPLDGGAVARVVRSADPSLAEGDLVTGMMGMGWRDRAVVQAGMVQKVDAGAVPVTAYLGVLGMPGLTAWAGLTRLIEPKAGETVFVSGAAGAVGSLVCQLAGRMGCRVIGSAGSEAKRDWLVREAGVDAALDYKGHDAASFTKALREAAPGGIDGYFENVGGHQLEAVLNLINDRGRIALCGLISQYNDTALTPGPSNFVNLLARQVRLEGFIVSRFMDQAPQFLAEVAPLVARGEIKAEETVYEGLESGPEAFIGLFSGANTGKAVVRIAG